MRKKIKVFFDLETTGLDSRKNGIHQIAGIVEVNDSVVETFDLKVRPNPDKIIEEAALNVGGVTKEQVLAYPEMRTIYKKLVTMLAKYIDKFNRRDKAWLVGYNNRAFDDPFLRAWFEQNGDSYFGSWFWSDSLDVMSLSSEYLQDVRANMPNFKLMSVAKRLGIVVDESKLHDGGYDVWLTREIYLIVTYRDLL